MDVNCNRKALIVSFHFPPNNTMGAVRIGKFAKYLPEFGWEPVVLTAGAARGLSQTLPVEMDESKIMRAKHFALVDSIGRRINKDSSSTVRDGDLRRTGTHLTGIVSSAVNLMEPVYTLPVIREMFFEPIGWYRHAVRVGIELAARQDISIIFSSYGPSVSHLVASTISKRVKIPWVCEFRDLWSSNIYTNKTQPFQFLEERWEKKTIKTSDLIISISSVQSEKLMELHKKNAVVISNGFDQEDYNENIPLTRKFTITYTGVIYPGKRDPSPLFKALAELRSEEKIFAEDIEVRFFGTNVEDAVLPLIKRYGVEEFVKIYGLVSFKESIRKQMESTVLLLLAWDDPKDVGTLSGKIFEYIGARRPILAIAFRGGEIDKLLKDSGCGIIANETSEIKSILIKWIDEFRQHGRINSCYSPKQEVVRCYTRKEQTRKLAETFNDVLM